MVLWRILLVLLSLGTSGMSAAIKRRSTRRRGLLPVSGPTGSGNTTSLASMRNFINDNDDLHRVTQEDPIASYHQHKKSTVNQREIRVAVSDFEEGRRRALRMDPDSLLVGEMRDLATLHAANAAAATGHVVCATLPTSGAASTSNRSSAVFPKQQQDPIRSQLATAPVGVLSPTLLPRQPQGPLAAYVLMVVTPARQNRSRANKVWRSAASSQASRKQGLFLLDESLCRLWKAGICAKEEVFRRASKPAELAAKIALAERGA